MLYLMNMLNVYVSALRNEEGQDFVEYALVVVLIALVIAAGATLGDDILSVFTDIATELGATG